MSTPDGLGQASIRFMEMFGLDLPIMQAPMDGPVTAELAAAVSNAGGLGSLPLTWLTAAEVTKTVAKVKALTDGPFFANYVLNFEPETFDLAIEAGVPAVQFSWGVPARYLMENLRAHSIKWGIQVTGHDSAREPDYKQLLLDGTAEETVFTVCLSKLWPNATHRILKNSTFRMWQAAGCPRAGQRPRENEVIARIGDQAFVRYLNNTPVETMSGTDVMGLGTFAGFGVSQIDDLPTVAELMLRIGSELVDDDPNHY